MSARRDAARVLLRIALRNLTAAPVRTAIIGAIVLVGALIVVVGSSLLDSIDRGMRTSIQGSLGGHLQVYDARSEGELELYGGLRGESLLEPIEDFARVKEVLSKVPNVRQVVPMGIDQAMVATGTTFDAGLERLREDVRRLEAGDRSPERRRLYEAHQAHVRRMIGLLAQDLDQARAIADMESRRDQEPDGGAPGGRARPGRGVLARARPRSLRAASSSSRTASRRWRWRTRSPSSATSAPTWTRSSGRSPSPRWWRGADPLRAARHPRRQAVRGGVAEAQERAAARSDQGPARPAREDDREGRGAPALGEGEPGRDPRDPAPARPAPGGGGRGGAPRRPGRGAGRGAGAAARPALRHDRPGLRREAPDLLRGRRAADPALQGGRRRHHHRQGALEERATSAR